MQNRSKNYPNIDYDKIIKLGVRRDFSNKHIIKKYSLYSSIAYSLKNVPRIYRVMYTDENYNMHVRTEEWEEIGRDSWRLILMRSISENVREGEQISLIW